MASAAAPRDPSDKLTCIICHEYFTTPKLLPCAHLLCRDCLLFWMQSNKDPRCPLCRNSVVEADSRKSRSLEDVVDAFPTDLSMVQLVETEKFLNKQRRCCACEEAVATHQCLNCSDMMCKSCASIHSKFSDLKDHVTKELSKMKAEKQAATYDQGSTSTYHANEVSSKHCHDHDEDSLCQVCAMTCHQSCQEELTELEDKMSEARSELAELVCRLNKGQSAINCSIQDLDRHLQETEKKTQALIQEIDDLCNRLDSAVKECRRHLKKLVHSASSEVKEAVVEGKACLLRRKGKLVCHKVVTERIQTMKASKDVRTMTAVMKARINSMDLSSTLPAGAKVMPEMTLEISAEAMSSCEKMLRYLGVVNCNPADLIMAQPKAMTWHFHKNHGQRIVLSDNNQTADRVTGKSNRGIVLACHPMQTETLYQVKLIEVLRVCGYGYNTIGVSTREPHTFHLPNHVFDGHPSAVLIDHSHICNQGINKPSNLGAALAGIGVGSRVGLVLDRLRNLHLYLDGRDLGVFACRIPRPCYVMIDLCTCWKKVTTLPLEPVKTEEPLYLEEDWRMN